MDAKYINCYWELAHAMIDCVGNYMQVTQLRDNLKDPETAWKVQKVFNAYYGGKMGRIDSKISRERDTFNKAVSDFNNLCKRNNLQFIVRPDRLFELLCDAKRRGYYRQRVNRYLEKGTIVALQDIEQDFLAKRRPHS